MLRDRQMSHKDSKAIAREIKGMDGRRRRSYPTRSSRASGAVPASPTTRARPPLSDIEGWDAGASPEKAAKAFQDLLENVKNNADHQGSTATRWSSNTSPPTRSVSPGRPRALRAPPVEQHDADVELILAGPEGEE